MMEFARRYLLELTQSVVAPIWAWVMARSWCVRAGILALIAATIGAVEYPGVPGAFYQEGYSLRRVFFAPAGKLPFNSASLSSLADTARRLSKSVAGDLSANKLNGIIMTPWSTAQAIVALDGAKGANISSDKIVGFVRENTAADCACWTELPAEKDGAQSLYISGWILAALADLGVPASPAELDYVLSKQNDSEGWWSTFSDSSQYQYASTYATGWVIIGLSEQKRRGLLRAEDVKRVSGAIEQASNWLLQHRNQNNGRWKAYPNLPAAAESESVSGLVVHALHVSGVVQTNEVDKEWLRNLPSRTISASDVENNYFEIKGPKRAFIDHIVQIKLPWVLVATADAYEAGDVWTRGKALRWMEANIADKSVSTADASDMNWWRAELLYALKRTLQHVS